jgi:uncharacterized protein YabE (DUF348 family)
MASANRPSPHRPGQRARRDGRNAVRARTTVYTSRARSESGNVQGWLPFPNVDPLQTLEDLLDDGELVLSGRTQAITDTAPVPAITRPKREPPPTPKAVRAPAPKNPLPTPERRRKTPLTRRARRQQLRRRQRRRLVFVAVAVLTAAVVALDLPRLLPHSRQVTIRVDGKELVSAQTDAKSVASALHEHDVKVNAEDRVRPRLRAKISDDMTVDVFRSFPVVVDLDGEVTPVRTTWATPDRLLEQLHLDPDKVSIATAPTRLTQGSSVAIRTLPRVAISVDGTQHIETTSARNVGEFLQQNRVPLGPEDELSPSADTGLADGMTISVSRIVKDIETNDEPLQPPP